VRVAAASEATLLSEITRLLDNALRARSRYMRLADRASRLYAPVVHATALLTVLGWVLAGASWHDAIVTGIAVLIITCLCARARDPDRADHGIGRDVQIWRPAQRR
jgi:Cu2+-exporting ATPase